MFNSPSPSNAPHTQATSRWGGERRPDAALLFKGRQNALCLRVYISVLIDMEVNWRRQINFNSSHGTLEGAAASSNQKLISQSSCKVLLCLAELTDTPRFALRRSCATSNSAGGEQRALAHGTTRRICASRKTSACPLGPCRSNR